MGDIRKEGKPQESRDTMSIPRSRHPAPELSASKPEHQYADPGALWSVSDAMVNREQKQSRGLGRFFVVRWRPGDS